jgi:hypothetical protein
MRNISIVRTAILSAALLANVAGIGSAFANSFDLRAQAPAHQANTGVYDSPDFVLDDSNIHS